jgi:hypothetical protein
MKRLIIVGLAALTLGLAAAPIAQADSYDFLYAAHNAGLTSVTGDAGLLTVGQVACRDLDAGWTPAVIVGRVEAANPMLNHDGALAIVANASVNLCPWDAAEPYFGWGSSSGSTLA